MLVGLTLPLHPATCATGSALNALDGVAAFLCIFGICFGAVADEQLWTFMQQKRRPLILDTGLWRYSRHPNHFGEQTWWIGLLLFGVAACESWASRAAWWPICFGVLFNHPLDTFVTLELIEERMMRRKERVEAFKEYQRRTSLIVPLPPSKLKEGKLKAK